ncbi:hypothetical protein Q3G72_000703 [Acer saccharum]|nr:hypothetical protein Q3G72_000703 [Acer saccharum]
MRNSQSEKGESSGKAKTEKGLGGTSANQNRNSKIKSPASTGVGEDDARFSDSLQSLVMDQQIDTDPSLEQEGKSEVGPSDKDIEMNGVGSPPKKTEVSEGKRPQLLKTGKKWKRAAREIKGQQIPVRLSSPLNKMLALNQKSRSNSKRNPQSPNQKSPTYKVSPKFRNRSSPTSPASLSKANRLASEMDGVKCKRKVDFSTEEEITERKKSKTLAESGKIGISAEPVEQAHREQ